MKTIDEEMAAIFEIAGRAKVHHAPNAPAFIAKNRPGAMFALEAISSTPAKASAGDMVICPLKRGAKLYRDNVTVRCADCRQMVEHRPEVPKLTVKLCAFCALRRLRGDA